MYYAAQNAYGSETSIGFSNTWYVLAFRSKKCRDAYVLKSDRLDVRPCKRDEITGYVGRPKPFTGQFVGIERWDEQDAILFGYGPLVAGIVGIYNERDVEIADHLF